MYTKIYSKEEHRLVIVNQLATLRKKNKPRFQNIINLIQNILKRPICMINIVDHETVWNKANVGYEMDEIHRPYSLCTHAIKNREALIIEDASKSEYYSKHPLVHSFPNIQFYAGFPLFVQNQAVGTLALADYQPYHLNDIEIKYLQSFVQWIELEFEYEFKVLNTPNCESCNAIVDITADNGKQLIDPISGLWNKVASYQILRRKLRRFLMLPKLERKPIGVIMFKIDEVQEIHHNPIHEDSNLQIIKQLSEIVQNSIRVNDSIGRYNQNDFLIIMQDCELEEMIKICERIRKSFENTPIRTNQGSLLMTLSLGGVLLMGSYISTTTEHIEDLLFSKAELALHSAQLKGQNRFEITILE